jgi:hypothetical protein
VEPKETQPEALQEICVVQFEAQNQSQPEAQKKIA